MTKDLNYYIETERPETDTTIRCHEFLDEGYISAEIKITRGETTLEIFNFEKINEAENFTYLALKYHKAIIQNLGVNIIKITKQTIEHQDIKL